MADYSALHFDHFSVHFLELCLADSIPFTCLFNFLHSLMVESRIDSLIMLIFVIVFVVDDPGDEKLPMA